MSTPKLNASVWVVLPEVYRVLSDAPWQTIAATGGKTPSVMFGTFDNLPGGESVFVTGSTRRSSQDWATSGTPGRDEAFEALLVVAVNVPGYNALRTFERLATIGRTLEDTMRDRATGHPEITDAMKAAGVWQLALTASDSTIQPLNSSGAAGWVGVATYVLSWSART